MKSVFDIPSPLLAAVSLAAILGAGCGQYRPLFAPPPMAPYYANQLRNPSVYTPPYSGKTGWDPEPGLYLYIQEEDGSLRPIRLDDLHHLLQKPSSNDSSSSSPEAFDP